LLLGIFNGEEEVLGPELGVSLGCTEGSGLESTELDGSELEIMLGRVDGLLLIDRLLDGTVLGSLLGIDERLGWIEGA
jgi:hypothetical protein